MVGFLFQLNRHPDRPPYHPVPVRLDERFQVLNFLYSVPQLFHLVPCPRHRLPKYDPGADAVGMSMSAFKERDLRWPGGPLLGVAAALGLVHLRRFEKDSECWVECNNLTLINFALKLLGPMHERRLTVLLLVFQVSHDKGGAAIQLTKSPLQMSKYEDLADIKSIKHSTYIAKWVKLITLRSVE